jgi:GNAT superfamily N-acetyltransferase
MINIEKISPERAEAACRTITTDLPEYFGLPECNEQYALGVRDCENFAAKINNKTVGLLSINFPYPKNSNIYWMGVLREFQGQGIGRMLLESAWNYAKELGANTMTVETLAPQEADENYLKTYKFYEAHGFEPLFNLKPLHYEWNMVYMVKNLSQIHLNIPNSQITIRIFNEHDVPSIVESFASVNWPKPKSIFETYFEEQKSGDRIMWVAYHKEQFAGYVTLKWQSKYKPYLKAHIPEIMDFNVLPQFRKQGIGSKLLDIAEDEASKRSDTVGIGVGLYEGYGAAQKLYIKRGYIPDGRPITYDYQPLSYGSKTLLDDDLVLWFTKKLK